MREKKRLKEEDNEIAEIEGQVVKSRAGDCWTDNRDGLLLEQGEEGAAAAMGR